MAFFGGVGGDYGSSNGDVFGNVHQDYPSSSLSALKGGGGGGGGYSNAGLLDTASASKAVVPVTIAQLIHGQQSDGLFVINERDTSYVELCALVLDAEETGTGLAYTLSDTFGGVRVAIYNLWIPSTENEERTVEKQRRGQIKPNQSYVTVIGQLQQTNSWEKDVSIRIAGDYVVPISMDQVANHIVRVAHCHMIATMAAATPEASKQFAIVKRSDLLRATASTSNSNSASAKQAGTPNELKNSILEEMTRRQDEVTLEHLVGVLSRTFSNASPNKIREMLDLLENGTSEVYVTPENRYALSHDPKQSSFHRTHAGGNYNSSSDHQKLSSNAHHHNTNNSLYPDPFTSSSANTNPYANPKNTNPYATNRVRGGALDKKTPPFKSSSNTLGRGRS